MLVWTTEASGAEREGCRLPESSPVGKNCAIMSARDEWSRTFPLPATASIRARMPAQLARAGPMRQGAVRGEADVLGQAGQADPV